MPPFAHSWPTTRLHLCLCYYLYINYVSISRLPFFIFTSPFHLQHMYRCLYTIPPSLHYLSIDLISSSRLPLFIFTSPLHFCASRSGQGPEEQAQPGGDACDAPGDRHAAVAGGGGRLHSHGGFSGSRVQPGRRQNLENRRPMRQWQAVEGGCIAMVGFQGLGFSPGAAKTLKTEDPCGSGRRWRADASLWWVFRV
jgi:hypothetical protein